MSRDLVVMVNRAAMPTADAIRERLYTLKPTVDLDPSFNPTTSSGVVPCRLDGRETGGFEYRSGQEYGGEDDEDDDDASEPNASYDTRVVFNARNNEQEAAALLVGATVAALSSGTVFDTHTGEELRGAEATAWAEQKVAFLLTGKKRKHDVKRELVKRLVSVLTPEGFAATRRVVATRVASSLLLHYVLFDELARDNGLSVSFGIRVINDARAWILPNGKGVSIALDLPAKTQQDLLLSLYTDDVAPWFERWSSPEALLGPSSLFSVASDERAALEWAAKNGNRPERARLCRKLFGAP
jgi:hypothetical protein